MIRDLIKNKPAKERATIKGQEIAKVKFAQRERRQNNDIEITSIKAIEGGVEIFARAWSKDGKQIGFGRDGSVDIERFVFINPPVLVPDPNGTIERKTTDNLTGEISIDKFREDAKEAILQTLDHTIFVTKKFDNKNIVAGKIGKTTTTVFPNAGTGTAPVDGFCNRTSGGGESYATLRSSAGTGSDATSVQLRARLHARNIVNPNLYEILDRAIIGFPTSAVGSDDISSVVLSVFVKILTQTLEDTTINFTSVTPGSESTIVASDYNIANYGSVNFTTGVLISTMSTGAFLDSTLNAAGRANINGAGNSIFAMRLGFDIDDNFGNSYCGDCDTSMRASAADETGTTQDPKLVIVHAGVAPTFIPRAIVY